MNCTEPTLHPTGVCGVLKISIQHFIECKLDVVRQEMCTKSIHLLANIAYPLRSVSQECQIPVKHL